MKLRIQGTNFDSNRSVKMELIDRKYHCAMHIHQFAEIVVPLSGRLTVHVDDRKEALEPGQAAFVFPFQPHGYSSSEKNHIAIFVFSPTFISDYFSALDGKIGKSSVFTPDAQSLAFFDKAIEKRDFDLLWAKGAFYILLSDYISKIPLIAGSTNHDISANIIKYATEHLTDDISAKDIADALGYSYNYISGKAKKIFGMSISSVIAAIRVHKAIELLMRNEHTLLEISNICGFKSQQSFNRQFKELIGMTPSHYRATAVMHTDNIITKYF